MVADLDPEIRRFVEQMSASWAQHPPLDDLPKAEARRIAETVRAPWARGGPAMQRTSELHVPFDNERVRVRVLDPTASGASPALVYLHGGGWTLFSIDTHDRLMREYAHRAQVVAVAVDYSLSPEVKFPRALQETVAVIRWLREHGASVGIDPANIAVGGDSAGANLSVAAALTLRDDGLRDSGLHDDGSHDNGSGGALKGMLLNYGAFDSACDYASFSRFGGAGYMLGGDEMVGFWCNYLTDGRHGTNPLACPLHANLEGLPAAFVTVAECDVLHDENIAMIDRLRRCGVSVQAQVYAGATHSFLEAVSISAVADRALGDGARWLRSIFARA